MPPLLSSFELRLLSPLGPGQEATISYGDNKPNAEVGGTVKGLWGFSGKGVQEVAWGQGLWDKERGTSSALHGNAC